MNCLDDLHERIRIAIDQLPPTDPLTLSLSRPDSEIDADHRVREIVKTVCASAPREVRERIEAEYFAAGPIETLLLESDVTEIIVNGLDSIWYEKFGRLYRHDDRFRSPLTFRNFIARLNRDCAIQPSLDRPFADGHWRDCRVHVAIPPASGDETVVSLRRHSLSPWTPERLLASGWTNQAKMNELLELVRRKDNFLVVGCTGSGKTSVLNACLMTLPETERVVIIEDTRELKSPNAASSRLLTRSDPMGLLRDIDQSELVRQALRMRPDRIVMGEIRGGEAKDLLMAFATGHSGCMGTLHADSARQALIRLEMLIQLGAPQWNLHAVRMLIWLSLKAIVVVGRTSEGNRTLEGIYRIAALEDVGFLIEKSA